MADGRLADATALLLARMRREADTGFPRVRRIPNSGVIRFLDYADGLADRQPLFESLALGFLPAPDSHDTLLRLMASVFQKSQAT